MYEVAHSPDAKLESGFYEAAVAREKRLLVRRKAEEILGVAAGVNPHFFGGTNGWVRTHGS
jgi:hypothetical protein